MFLELFLVGTFWFWVLLGAEFFFIIWCLESESHVLAPFSFLLVVLAVTFFGNVNIFPYIWHNPLWSLLWAALYFVPVGVVWGVVKWWFFIRNIRDKNREVKRAWLGRLDIVAQDFERYVKDMDGREQVEKFKKQAKICRDAVGTTQMTEDLLPIWKEHEEEIGRYDRRQGITKPDPVDFKARIVSWIAWWPASFVWTVLNDPFRRIAQQLYYTISGILSRMADSAWKNEDNVV